MPTHPNSLHQTLNSRRTQQRSSTHGTPVHQQAVNSGKILNVQFYKSACSITPPPDATDWAQKNRMIVDSDGTQQLSRQACSKRTTNIISASAAVIAPLHVDIKTLHGGSPKMKKILCLRLLSGKVDNEVNAWWSGWMGKWMGRNTCAQCGL